MSSSFFFLSMVALFSRIVLSGTCNWILLFDPSRPIGRPLRKFKFGSRSTSRYPPPSRKPRRWSCSSLCVISSFVRSRQPLSPLLFPTSFLSHSSPANQYKVSASSPSTKFSPPKTLGYFSLPLQILLLFFVPPVFCETFRSAPLPEYRRVFYRRKRCKSVFPFPSVAPLFSSKSLRS